MLNVEYCVFFAVLYLMIFALNKRNIKKRQACLLVGFMLFLGVACRNIDQGLNDTRDTYMGMFEIVTSTEWSSLQDSIVVKYTSVLFIAMMKMIAILSGGSYRIYLIFSAILFIYGFEKLFIKHSDKPLIAQIVFIATLYPYGFFLVRQCISMSFMALSLSAFLDVADKRVKNKGIVKRYWKAIIWAVLGSLIHSVALVPFVFFGCIYIVLKKFEVNKRNIYCVIFVGIVAILVVPQSFSLVLHKYIRVGSKYGNLLSLGVYDETSNLWLIPILLYSFFSIYLIWKYRKRYSPLNECMVACSLLAVLFSATTVIVGDMIRIAYYFLIPMVLLLSNSVEVSDKSIHFAGRLSVSNLSVVALSFFYTVFVALPSNNIINFAM